MKLVTNTISTINTFQQKHAWAGFPYAVVKKYGDDEAGYQGALMTYYAFLSLFPLLIVATSLLQLLFGRDAHLRARLLLSITHYFPIIGNELQQNVHSRGGTGLTLLIGTIITLYGAQGVASASSYAFNQLWYIPKAARTGFPLANVKSLAMIVVGGLGIVIAGFLSSYAGGFGHEPVLRVVLTLASLLVLITALFSIFKIGISGDAMSASDALRSAVLAGIGAQVLQSFGGYLIVHELKNLTTLYGTFALVLALLFWLYLQVEVVLYAIEATTVRRLGLWPRSLTSELTPQDKLAQRLYAKGQSIQPRGSSMTSKGR